MESTGTGPVDVVDIRDSNLNAAQQLLNAVRKNGFVFIENKETGIEPADIDYMFDLSRQFFASPLEVKEQVSISSNKAGKNHGWLSRGVEKLDPSTQKRPDVKEAFNMGETVTGRPQQPMPKTLQGHVDTMVDFQRKCHNLCQRIFELFAIALDIDQNWFTSRHGRDKGDASSIFRMLYYPKIDTYENGIDIRAGAHSDYGSITLLFQQRSQPGLEIMTPSGEWAAVPVDPHDQIVGTFNGGALEQRAPPILVNIGDLLDDWTNGLLKSTVHRVIFPQDGGCDRYSMAYFCHPLDDARLEPVPSKLVEEHAARTGKSKRNGKVITAKDHLMKRLAATYTVDKEAD